MAKLSIQGGLNNGVPLSKFEKGPKEVGSPHANFLQAKDRLKWLFRKPLQDRLVEEKHLRGIWTTDEGNGFLEVSLPLHNKMFSAYPMGEDNPPLRPLTKGRDWIDNKFYVHSESWEISIRRNLKSLT